MFINLRNVLKTHNNHLIYRNRIFLNKNYGNYRLFSTQNEYNLIPNYKLMGNSSERNEYKSYFTDIVNELKNPYVDFPNFQKHYVRLLECNVPHYKQATGFTVVAAYKGFESLKLNNHIPENIRLANILGWCVDLFLSFYIVTDDIIDSSETRFGFPCWYRNPDIGMEAINDGILIKTSPFMLLKNNFSDRSCYGPLIELFRKVYFKISIGQTLDTMAVMNGKPRYEVFTMDIYKTMVKNKSAYPFFVLPVAAAMHFSGKYGDEYYQKLESILFRLGEYLQIQNDMSDCYGNPEVTGKKGNDICEGRNTWLIVKALENSTIAQHKLIKQYYGKPDIESEQAIREMYDSLHILDNFLQYEEEVYNSICKDIPRIADGALYTFLVDLTNAVFVRNKDLN